MKILVLAGTRPEVIKLAPVILALKAESNFFQVTVCTTGQHREMIHQAFSDFGIQPDIDLEVMQHKQSLAGLSAKLFSTIDNTLIKQKPDCVLVQGDTTTVMVASLCSFYHGIKIGHIEAGLRSFNRLEPFPEETNRRVASLVADFHFAPTDAAQKNLLQEGINPESILITGNTVIDALLWIQSKIHDIHPKTLHPAIGEAVLRNRKIVLITGHRRESIGFGFQEICMAIKELSIQNREILFVYPVHLNPDVKKPVTSILANQQNVLLLEPLPYRKFIRLMQLCNLILTDSGGIQEEGPSLGKPVLVMRNTTERPEGVEAGTTKLIGVKKDHIVCEVNLLLKDRNLYKKMARSKNPYGDGLASQRIVESLKVEFGSADIKNCMI